MKRKIFFVLLLGVLVLGLTGCGKSNQEVTINGAYVLDYNNEYYLGDKDKVNMIVILNIKPKEDILLKNSSIVMNVGDKKITGTVYDKNVQADIVYDLYDELLANEEGRLVYSFEFEKYLYKENSTYSLEYKLGTQKGEYSYIIEDNVKINKKDVKEVELLEDIVKDIYKENANDALMILSLKWKINDILERVDTFNKFDMSTQIKYDCYYNGTAKRGNKLLNYFAEFKSNNISISNRFFLGTSSEEPDIKYRLPLLNYEVIERYYPGITNSLKELNDEVNEYAKDLIKIKNGKCGTKLLYPSIGKKANKVNNYLNGKYNKDDNNKKSNLSIIPTMYIFYGNGCIECEELFKWLEELDYEKEYNVVKFEVWENQSDLDLMHDVADRFNRPFGSVPLVVIGKHYVEGFVKEDIIKALDQVYKDISNGKYEDVVK